MRVGATLRPGFAGECGPLEQDPSFLGPFGYGASTALVFEVPVGYSGIIPTIGVDTPPVQYARRRSQLDLFPGGYASVDGGHLVLQVTMGMTVKQPDSNDVFDRPVLTPEQITARVTFYG